MANPNQEIIESRLATYIDGELDSAERVEIEQHLEQNPQYRRVIDDLRKQRDLLRTLPREAAPLDLGEAFTSQLERAVLLEPTTGRSRPMRIFAPRRVLAAAAVVLLTVGLGAIVYFMLPGRASSPAVVIHTPSPGEHEIEMPGGQDEKLAQQNEQTPDGKTADAMGRRGEQLEVDRPRDKALAEKAGDAKGTSSAPTTPAPIAPAAPPALAAVTPKPGSAATEDLQRREIESVALGVKRSLDVTPAFGGPHALALAREAELDQLARNISNDPQVKGLLAGDRQNLKDASASAGQPSPNVRVLVVCADDPKQVESQIVAFLDKDRIDWRPAPQPVEVALNASLAQQKIGAQDAMAMNKRAIDAKAMLSLADEGRVERQQQALRKSGEVAAQARVPAPAEPAETGLQSGGRAMARAQGTEKGGETEQLMQTREAKEQVAFKQTKGATLGASTQLASAIADNTKAPAFTGEPVETTMGRMVRGRVQSMADNPAPVESLYVARRLSRQQIESLHTVLARGSNDQNDVAPRDALGTYEAKAVYGAPATTQPAQSATAKAEPRHYGEATDRLQEESAGRRGATASTTAPASQPTAFFNLRDRDAGTARLAPAPQAAGGAPAGGVDKPAPSAPGAVSNGAVAHRQGLGVNDNAGLTTEAFDGVEGLEDVVIVVQRPGTGNTIAAPPAAPAPGAPVAAGARPPATAPTTRPAATGK